MTCLDKKKEFDKKKNIKILRSCELSKASRTCCRLSFMLKIKSHFLLQDEDIFLPENFADAILWMEKRRKLIYKS